MNFDFSQIKGPKHSKEENFELLICQLLTEEFNATSINGKGGDGGIDCFVKRENGDLEIFQMKYFINNLTPANKSQIKKSFDLVLKRQGLTKWILCIPRDHTPGEKSWFESINKSYRLIEWWGETKLRNLLAKHSIISKHFFPEEEIMKKLDDIAKEINNISLGKIKSPNTLPRTISTFTGRETYITEIKKIINDSQSSIMRPVIISSIDGMPGVGKTSLAVQIAHILSVEYPEAQLYIDCYGYTVGQRPLTAHQILDSLLFSLGVSNYNIPKEINEKAALWRSILATRRMVILLDNVKTISQIISVLPGTANTLVLITSRNRLTDLVGSFPLSVDLLSEQEAILLIKKIVGDNADEESHEVLSSIARLCGYLPLTINIVAGRWRRRKLENAEVVVKILNDPKQRLTSITSAEYSMHDIFDLSYNSLNPIEKRMLQIMGIHPGINFTIGACAAMLGIKIGPAYKAFTVINEESLLIETKRGRYKLHDLLREYSQGKFYNLNKGNKVNQPFF